MENKVAIVQVLFINKQVHVKKTCVDYVQRCLNDKIYETNIIFLLDCGRNVLMTVRLEKSRKQLTSAATVGTY